ncbi:MAG: hypothetical protein U0V04_12580 [Spirosomataceae bacterium]|jgi:hypothetical protein
MKKLFRNNYHRQTYMSRFSEPEESVLLSDDAEMILKPEDFDFPDPEFYEFDDFSEK